MQRFHLGAFGSLVVLLNWTGGSLDAQPPYSQPGIGQLNRPAYSPYLNLLRPGNPTYANYYGLVRPELDIRAAAVGLQQQVNANQQGISNLQTAYGPLTTGHVTRFMNTSGYFLSSGGGQGTGQGIAQGLGQGSLPGMASNRPGLASSRPGLATASPTPTGISRPSGSR